MTQRPDLPFPNSNAQCEPGSGRDLERGPGHSPPPRRRRASRPGSAAQAGNGQATLSWTAPTNAASYEYQQGIVDGATCRIGTAAWTPAGTASPFTVKGLASGGYCFRVRAYNGTLAGPASDTVLATVTFPAPALTGVTMSRLAYGATVRTPPALTAQESFDFAAASALGATVPVASVGACATGATRELGWYKSDALTTRLGTATSDATSHTLAYTPTEAGEYRALAYCTQGTGAAKVYSAAANLMGTNGKVTLTGAPAALTPDATRLLLSYNAILLNRPSSGAWQESRGFVANGLLTGAVNNAGTDIGTCAAGETREVGWYKSDALTTRLGTVGGTAPALVVNYNTAAPGEYRALAYCTRGTGAAKVYSAAGNLMGANGKVTLTAPALAASAVTHSSATLTRSDHTGTWHYRANAAPHTACSAAQTGDSVNLTGLVPGTSYTYKMYSDAACQTEVTTDATDAEFTTDAAPLAAPALTGTPVLVVYGTDQRVPPGAQETFEFVDSTSLSMNIRVDAVGACTGAGVTRELGWYKSDALTTRLGNVTTVGAGSHFLVAVVPAAAGEYLALAYCTRGTGAGKTYSAAANLMGANGKVTLTAPAPGVEVSVNTPFTVPEGHFAQYSIRLKTQPTHPVTVTVTKAGGGDPDLTADTDPATPGNQSTVTLTAANWAFVQNVAVHAAEDADEADGRATFTHAASSTDPAYNAIAVDSVTAIEADNDGKLAVASFTAAPNPVEEGSPLTLTLTVAAAPGVDKHIGTSFGTGDGPGGGTAEQGDFSGCGLVVRAGQSRATCTVRTVRDEDIDDETFTVGLGGSNVDGSHSLVVTILDDKGLTDPDRPRPLDPDLAAPGALQAMPGDGRVRLDWAAVANAAGYEYQYKTTGEWGRWIGVVPGTGYAVTRLDNQVRHTFRVRALNTTGGAGAPSSEAVATPLADLAAGLALWDVRGAQRNRAARLTWSMNERFATRVEVRRREGLYERDADGRLVHDANDYPVPARWGAWTAVDRASWKRHTVSGLAPGEVYAFELRAWNGAYSGPVAEVEQVVPGGVELRIADARAREPRAGGAADLSFVVTLTHGERLRSLPLRFETRDGTAHEDEDYAVAFGPEDYDDYDAYRADLDRRGYFPDEAGGGGFEMEPLSGGRSTHTLRIKVLPDAHNEGTERMTLVLTLPSDYRETLGITVVDLEATGTITNDGPVPQAWIARFGRTVADQVIGAVEGRMQADRAPGAEVSLAGERIGLGPAFGAEAPGSVSGAGGEDADAARERTEARKEAEAQREALRLGRWLKGAADPDSPGQTGARAGFGAGTGAGFGAGAAERERTMDGRELLLGSSFALTSRTADGGSAAFWGRGAVTRFEGREDGTDVDGEVTTALLGADWSPGSGPGQAGRATMGLILGHSRGEGGYRAASGGGTVSSTLTGLYPWGRYALSERVSVWGVAGFGEGTLALTPENVDGTRQATLRADLDLMMGALGLRGTLLDGGGDGLTLAAKTDAMAVRTSSGRGRSADGGTLAASEATVTRLRLGLEASRPVALGADGTTLTPSLEVGVRQDGGDAETGFGVDLGGGLAFSAPGLGLEAELRARGLLTHEADGFRERGLSGALEWRQKPGTDRGATLSLTQTVGGAASGGADALLGRTTLQGLAANDNGGDLRARRLEVRLGYGISAFSDRFTLTPEAGAGFADSGRDWRVGLRLTPVGDAGALELSFEALRREAANDGGSQGAAEHEVGVRLQARW